MRRQQAVKSQRVKPRGRNQDRNFLDELQRIQQHVGRSIRPRVRQLEHELPVRALRQSLQRQGRAQEIAAVVAALLLLWLWDWGLVVLSSPTGATLLAPLPRLASPLGGLLFVGLFLVGLVVQATQLAAQSKVSRASTARRS